MGWRLRTNRPLIRSRCKNMENYELSILYCASKITPINMYQSLVQDDARQDAGAFKDPMILSPMHTRPRLLRSVPPAALDRKLPLSEAFRLDSPGARYDNATNQFGQRPMAMRSSGCYRKCINRIIQPRALTRLHRRHVSVPFTCIGSEGLPSQLPGRDRFLYAGGSQQVARQEEDH